MSVVCSRALARCLAPPLGALLVRRCEAEGKAEGSCPPQGHGEGRPDG